MYDLIELIIEASHQPKDYLIFDIHTQHTSMFNECHIHSCDCTCLNLFSHAQSLLINHKKIFECFSCFWKVFCFYKNLSKFQKQSYPSGDSVAGRTSRMPQSRVHTKIFRDSLVTHWCVNASVAKKTQNIFQKSGFSCFSQLRLATFLQVEGPVTRGTQRFSQLRSRLSREWNFQL